MIVDTTEAMDIVDNTKNIDDTIVKENTDIRVITEIDMSGIDTAKEMTVNIDMVNITMINKIV